MEIKVHAFNFTTGEEHYLLFNRLKGIESYMKEKYPGYQYTLIFEGRPERMSGNDMYEKIAVLMDKIMYHDDEYPFEVQSLASHVECEATNLADVYCREYTPLEEAMVNLIEKLLEK